MASIGKVAGVGVYAPPPPWDNYPEVHLAMIVPRGHAQPLALPKSPMPGPPDNSLGWGGGGSSRSSARGQPLGDLSPQYLKVVGICMRVATLQNFGYF